MTSSMAPSRGTAPRQRVLRLQIAAFVLMSTLLITVAA
jgi:hypothetical protein